MKIAYIAETSIFNKSAYSQHVIKMCDAFSQNNQNLLLILPNADKKIKFRKIKKEFLLNSKKTFKIKSVLNFKVKNFISRSYFGFKVSKFLKKNQVDLIITRSFVTSIFLSLFKINHFIELHSELQSITKFIMIDLNFIKSKYILKVILISKALNKIFKISKEKALILHDGVDINNFKKKKIKKLKKIKSAAYVGSFYKGRGIEIIIGLSKKFKNIKFKLYGQNNANLNFKSKNNVKFYGHIPYKMVPLTLSNSDILLMPYASVVHVRSKNVNTANYCSPLKMFDYLASGKIIISSKLNGICEVLKHEYNALLAEKYSIESWSKTLNNLLSGKYNISKLSKNSILTAKKYTWNKRVKIILNTYMTLK